MYDASRAGTEAVEHVAHVALHARRGDVMSNARKAHRRVPNEFYRRILARVHEVLSAKRIDHQLHVFSEGKPADFDNMTAGLPTVQLHLNTDDYAAWHCLGRADLLITSGSGAFSSSAAFYASNRTHVLYANWQLQHEQDLRRRGTSGDATNPLDEIIPLAMHWHVVAYNGSVAADDEARYVRALRRRARTQRIDPVSSKIF